MRKVMLATAAAVAWIVPVGMIEATPASLSEARQALSTSTTVRYRGWSRDYADEAPWRHHRFPRGKVPPPVGGGGGASFSNGRGIGGPDTASTGTAAFWGTNSRPYSGN
jgi:hypothetical protein